MSTSTRIISETSLNLLLQTGNSIIVSSGFRTVSMQSISSFTSNDTIDVPDILNSSETLQFCGMSKEVSDMLYQKWLSDQNTISPGALGHGVDIIELSRYYVKEMGKKHNAYLDSDDWSSALKQQGISEVTRSRIMNPKFKDLRLSSSAREWALDTLNLSWEFLDGLDSRIKRLKKESDLRSPSPDPSVKAKAAIKPTSSLNSTLHDGNATLQLATIAEPPIQLPEKAIFFKGGGWDRLISIFNTDGSLNLKEIVSKPPTDFHPTAPILYFTKQLDVAVHYAEYAGERVPAQIPTVMTVAVPQSIMSLAQIVVGTDWQNLIWQSRNEDAVVKAGFILPSHLSHYADAEVLIGNICGTSSDQVSRLNSPDEIQVMRTKKGEKGSQIVLQGSNMLESQGRFVTECRGFVWVAPLASPKKAHHYPAV